MLIFVQVYKIIDKIFISYKVLKEQKRAKESTKRKLEASEEKWFWSQVLLKWWRHQKQVHQKHLIRSNITRSWSSSEDERLKASEGVQWIVSRPALQKTERVKQRPTWKNLKTFNACSLKSVDKGKLYELCNHLLHYERIWKHSMFVSLHQEKNNSYVCSNVPSD